jgi:hypothetical protein
MNATILIMVVAIVITASVAWHGWSLVLMATPVLTDRTLQFLLSGVKRTSGPSAVISASDPKRTWVGKT